MVWPRSIWKEARSEKFFQVEADTILGRKRFYKGARTNAVQSKKRRTRMAPMKIEPKSEQNLDGYGAPLIPWSKIRDRLDQGFTQEPEKGGPNRHTCWLTTVRPDGRPHVMPLGAEWVDGAFYFTSGANTRKAKNLALNPECVITVATHDFDIVVEGRASRVTDPALVARIAKIYQDGGWPAQVSDDGTSLTAQYSAPSAGPPPYLIYQVIPRTVFALGAAEPYGATSFRF